MNEIPFKTKVLKVMREKHGAVTYPLIASERSPAGWPDTLVISWLWSGLIEFKGDKTRLEPVQDLVRLSIVKRNFACHIVRSVKGELCVIDEQLDNICYWDGLLEHLGNLRKSHLRQRLERVSADDYGGRDAPNYLSRVQHAQSVLAELGVLESLALQGGLEEGDV